MLLEPNQNNKTFTGDKLGRSHIKTIVQYITPAMANEFTRLSEGHTVINSQLYPIGYEKNSQ